MGQAVPIIGAIGDLDCCGTWAKYVFNSGRCHSRCGEWCDLQVETDKVDVDSDDSELDVEVDGCCKVHM